MIKPFETVSCVKVATKPVFCKNCKYYSGFMTLGHTTNLDSFCSLEKNVTYDPVEGTKILPKCREINKDCFCPDYVERTHDS